MNTRICTVDDQTTDLRELVETTSLVASPRSVATRVRFEHHYVGGFVQRAHHTQSLVVGVSLTPADRRGPVACSVFGPAPGRSGCVDIAPPGSYPEHRVPEGEIALLELSHEVVGRAMREFSGASSLSIAPHLGVDDRRVNYLMLAMKDEAAAGFPSGRVFVEGLVAALVSHFARTYSKTGGEPRTLRGGLPPHKLRVVLEYVHDNLDRDVSLLDLADLLGMGPDYFARTFKQSTGFSPHQYVLWCRIDRARALLRETSLPLTEIAYRLGFSSQSHFTLAFRKITGTTPGAYRAPCRELVMAERIAPRRRSGDSARVAGRDLCADVA